MLFIFPKSLTHRPGFFFPVNRWFSTCYQNSRKSLPEQQNLVAEEICQTCFTNFFMEIRQIIFCLIYFLLNVGQKQVFFSIYQIHFGQ